MSDKKFRRILFTGIALLFLLAGTFMLFVNQLRISGRTFHYGIVLFGGVNHSVTYKAAVPSTIGYIGMSVFGLVGLAASVLDGQKCRIATIVALVCTAVCVAFVFMTAFWFKAANPDYCAGRAMYIIQGPILGGIFGSIGLVGQLAAVTQVD